MKKTCEKHHLVYTENYCPLCEKERISSFKVSKPTKVLVGQASRESYFNEYKQQPTISDDEMENMLLSKFGNLSKLKN